MRLWVLALLALLFVGLLVAVEQSGLFDSVTGRNTRNNNNGLMPVFEDYERGSIPFFDDDGRKVFVAQVYPGTPQILAGFPSYSSAKFRLPVDSRPLSGTDDLEFAADAVPEAEGALRITINGVRRADTLLQPGRSRQRVQVELTPSELAAGDLDVGLALVGRGPMAECTPNEALAAVVTVLPESGLRLTLNEAPSSVAIGWLCGAISSRSSGKAAPSPPTRRPCSTPLASPNAAMASISGTRGMRVPNLRSL